MTFHRTCDRRHRMASPAVALTACAALTLALLGGKAGLADSAGGAGTRSSLARVIATTQAKIAKVQGAGGYRGLEPYQSGIVISPDGYLLTVYGYVLDTDRLSVTLNDGRRFDATLVGADPGREVALLKIDATGLDFFDLAEAGQAEGGERILAFSNLFGLATGNEAASVQHGVISVKTTLDARRGTFSTPYTGPVYVLDAVTNNPGAAGGALVDRRGNLLGMLGKELRGNATGVWLNYAVPIEAVAASIQRIREGESLAEEESQPEPKPDRALDLASLGLIMVPDVVDRTPPFVEAVRHGSPGAEAGIRPDDLIVLVDDQVIQSGAMLREELSRIDYRDEVQLTLMRGQELIEVVLREPLSDTPEAP